MRLAPLLVVLVPLSLHARADEPAKRFGIAADTTTYPQATPRETFASAMKAIDAKKIDYLLAQLSDPAFVTDHVDRIHRGKFAEQVADTTKRLDPATVKLLRRFLEDGRWSIGRTTAVVHLPGVREQVVHFIAKDGRWYLAHSSDPRDKD